MSKSNAFVFDAALIRPFFEGPDVAKYMIAYLGAAGDHPTILLAPAIEGSNPNKIALMMAVPPREQPPRFVYARFLDQGELDMKDLHQAFH